MKRSSIVSAVRLSFFSIGIYTFIISLFGFLVAGDVVDGSKVQWLFILFLVLAVISGFVAARLICNTIRSSLKQLNEIGKALAEGNTDIDTSKKADNEFGDVIDQFAMSVASTKTHALLAEKIAKGDLAVNVEVRSQKDTLGQALLDLVNDNNQVLSGIKESSVQLTAGASQVASASQALAQGSTEQASAIEQINASMVDIANKTNNNASKVSEVDQLIHTMKENSKQGSVQMGEMVAAMESINKASHSISKVIKTIDDIAFQTNILALNATVEAARAGVHGKGFAVVAEEVKALAEKSAAAAAETSDMIQTSIDKTESGTKLVSDMEKSLTTLSDAIEGIVANIDVIATASNEQATAVTQINQAINQVSQVVQTNSATSEQCAAASEELSNQADTLRKLIDGYRLKDNMYRNNTYNPSFSQKMIPTYQNNQSSYNPNESIISLDGNFGKY